MWKFLCMVVGLGMVACGGVEEPGAVCEPEQPLPPRVEEAAGDCSEDNSGEAKSLHRHLAVCVCEEGCCVWEMRGQICCVDDVCQFHARGEC